MANQYRVRVIETYARGADLPWSVARQVVGHDRSGRCEHPVTIRGCGQTRLLACARRLPADQQCAACRTHTVIVDVRRIIQ
ncbi:hypothetical protein GCM10009733_005780 [Nonomuraea maheshkhaliensis]|uniref:Transposase n=1 Tax=Nonomuraea maheshkhaliensis TaxID=419590 RepID=A0ABN2ENA6_9ACTN